MADEQDNSDCNSIAVIGYGCRFPGANNPEDLWDILMNKIDATDAVPENGQWKESIRSHIKRGGFLKCSVDEVDAEFFGLPPLEAEILDPRQRLLLEVTWESLEDAGIDSSTLKGSKTDVFVGLWSPDYATILKDCRKTCCEISHKSIYLSSGHGISSARLAHFLGLRGYHESFDAGCSSSLIGLHESCASLLREDCNLAIAAGVNLILTSKQSKIDSLVLAPNGRCKTFDAEADGYSRAEGIGVLILKRLSDAIKNRDRIHAIIRGTGANYNSGSSFGSPDREGQVLAIEEALKMSNLSPEQINFLEAHGTGVLVGDTVEIEALSSVYSRNRDQANVLLISSLKANIGHSEAASGMAAVIKVILSMKNEIIPPQFPVNKINPEIEKQLRKMHGEIPVEPVPWKRNLKKRFAGVSGFALGGENVHVILEEAPVAHSPSVYQDFQRNWHVLTLSAVCEKSLAAKIELYIDFLQENRHCNILDVVFSANCGRTHFNHRVAVVGRNIQEIENSLRLNNYYKNTEHYSELELPQICFIFKTDLKPEISIVKYLCTIYPAFKDTFDICSHIAENILNISLKDLLETHDNDSLSTDITVAETIMKFVANYSLLKLWEYFGVKPSFIVVIGATEHLGGILGEIIANTLTIPEGINILAGFSRKHGNKLLNTGNMYRLIALNNDHDVPENSTHDLKTEENSMKTIMVHLRDNGCTDFFVFGCSSPELPQSPENYLNRSEMNRNEQSLVTWKWSVHHKQDLWKLIVLNLSRLYVKGTQIRWDNFERPFTMNACKVDLPKYPFQRKKYWVGDSWQQPEKEIIGSAM